MQRAGRLLVCALAVLAATACSGGDDDDDAAATTSERPERTDATDERDEAVDDSERTDGTVTSIDSPDGTAGRDGTSADRADFVVPLADNLRDANDALDDEQAVCLAEAVVDTVGIDRLVDSGMTPEEFAAGDGDLGEGRAFGRLDQEPLTDALVACGGLVDVFVVDDDLSRDAQACIRGAVNDRTAAELMAAELTGATPSDEARQAAATLRECAALDPVATTTTRPSRSTTTTTTRRSTTTTSRPSTTSPGATTTTGADARNRD